MKEVSSLQAEIGSVVSSLTRFFRKTVIDLLFSLKKVLARWTGIVGGVYGNSRRRSKGHRGQVDLTLVATSRLGDLPLRPRPLPQGRVRVLVEKI